jgi:transcriptional regulator with XRE-family HTH domain
MNPGAVLGIRVRELRTGKNLSQSGLATRLDELGIRLDRSAIARIERGARTVSIDEAIALAAALDVPLHALLLPHLQPVDEEFELTPALTVRVGFAAGWLAGQMPLDRMGVKDYSEGGDLLRLASAVERMLPRLLSEEPNQQELEMARAFVAKQRLEADEFDQMALRVDVLPDFARGLEEMASEMRENAERIEALLSEEEDS